MLPIIKPLTPEERGLVGSTWAYRAESEVRAVLRFSSLGQALRVHGASPTVLELCDRAVRDEERHVGICAKLAREFGIEPQIEGITRPGPLAPSDLPVDQQVFYEVVAVCCINETINATLLGHVYEQSKWPSIRLAAHTLLEDEIWHSRMGWAHLGAEQPRRDLSWLSPLIVPMLEATGAHEIFNADQADREAPHLAAYGEFNYATRVKIFTEVVNTVILPGFESFGLDVSSARGWINELSDRHRSAKR